MQVLLVHGMGRTPLSMLRLGRKLRREGHTVNLLGYMAAVEPFARIVRRMQERFARIAAGGPYVVVGHSLGGLLTRAALGSGSSSFTRPAHLIMLGTPTTTPPGASLRETDGVSVDQRRVRPASWSGGLLCAASTAVDSVHDRCRNSGLARAECLWQRA